jgi:hypothetical protein
MSLLYRCVDHRIDIAVHACGRAADVHACGREVGICNTRVGTAKHVYVNKHMHALTSRFLNGEIKPNEESNSKRAQSTLRPTRMMMAGMTMMAMTHLQCRARSTWQPWRLKFKLTRCQVEHGEVSR